MGSAMNLFLVLVAATIVTLYALRLRPKNRRQWLYLAITLAFLAWILPLMAALRSR